MRLLLALLVITQMGCSSFLIGYVAGTASNLTSDMIMRELEKEKKQDVN
jgi:hypothetical protein